MRRHMTIYVVYHNTPLIVGSAKEKSKPDQFRTGLLFNFKWLVTDVFLRSCYSRTIQIVNLWLEFDFSGPPGLVKPGIQRTIEAQ